MSRAYITVYKVINLSVSLTIFSSLFGSSQRATQRSFGHHLPNPHHFLVIFNGASLLGCYFCVIKAEVSMEVFYSIYSSILNDTKVLRIEIWTLTFFFFFSHKTKNCLWAPYLQALTLWLELVNEQWEHCLMLVVPIIIFCDIIRLIKL